MATTTKRLIRGPPPSPPQSNDGDPSSEARPESCGIFHSLYGGQGTFVGVELHALGRSSETALDQHGSQSVYASSSDYPHGLPLSHTVAPNGLQVNTPPASDDSTIPGGLQSVAKWASPSPQKQSPQKARVVRSPRIRRRTRKTKDREPRAQLPGPLSELTRHMSHVPIRDMESWVHRPITVRHQEVAKKNGKVARPMNSFMLYRSAYADRTKEWFSQNNHQVVSEAAGDSWKLEPREVREKYELLANIEKHNHLKAHPGYKFTPAKDKKKRPGPEEDHSVHNNMPEPCPALVHAHTLSSSEVDSTGWESNHSTPFDLNDHGLPNESYLGHSWPTHNPSRPLSSVIPSSDPSHYLHQSPHQNLMMYNMEDTEFKKSELQEFSYNPSTTLAGLPGAAHHDLLQPQTQLPTSTSYANAPLDPQLLNLRGDASGPDSGSQLYGNSHYSMWQESPTTNCYLPVTTSLIPSGTLPFHGGSSFQPGMQALMDGREAWESSQDNTIDSTGGEFDHWINNQSSSY